jgi:hypothetical protein
MFIYVIAAQIPRPIVPSQILPLPKWALTANSFGTKDPQTKSM